MHRFVTVKATLVLFVALAAICGFSLTALSGGAATISSSSSSAPDTAAPTATPQASGAILPLANSSSGFSATSPTALGSYLVEPENMAPAGASPLPSDITVEVALNPSANLESFVNELSNPNNPNYDQFLTINEIGSDFGSSSYAAAVDYFESYGLSVGLSSGLLTLSVSGTPGEMESAFHTTVQGFAQEYQSNGTWNPAFGNESAVAGSTTYAAGFYANTAPLALPSSLTGVIAGVAGLSGVMAQPDLALPTGIGPNDASANLTLAGIQGLAGGNYTWTNQATTNAGCEELGQCGDVQTLYPSTMHELDGAENLWNGSTAINGEDDLGQGVTIALIEVGCLDTADITTVSGEIWDNSDQPGLPLSERLTQIGLNTPGAIYPNDDYSGCSDNGAVYGWTTETALDAEYAATEAPDASIDIVATASSDFSAFDVAFQDVAQYLTAGATNLPESVGTVVWESGASTSSQAVSAAAGSVTITSNSYGSGEVPTALEGSPSYLTVENTLLEELNAVGVTNFFSSGDYAPAYQSSAANSATIPSDSPGATAVGGGQATAESNGVEYPLTPNIICPSGYAFVGNYSGVAYCSLTANSEVQQVVDTIGVGSIPEESTYDPANGYLYISDYGSEEVTVLDGTSVAATIPAGPATYWGAYDPADGYVYVANPGGGTGPTGTVTVIDGTTLVTTLHVGNSDYRPFYDPADGDVYVTNCGSNNVTVFSGTSLVGSVAAGVCPFYGAYDPADGDLYIADSNSGQITIINGTSVVATLDPVPGDSTYSATYDAANGDIYATEISTDSGACGGGFACSVVVLINGTNVVGSVTVGSISYYDNYDSANGLVYVTNDYSDNVSVIEGTSLVGTLDTGEYAVSPAFNSTSGDAYFPNMQSNSVSVVNGTSILTTIQVGQSPAAAAYDVADGDVYVNNWGAASVSVIAEVHLNAALSAEECYETGIAVGECVSATVVAPATGLASFSYWSFGGGELGVKQGYEGASFGQSISSPQPWYQNGLDTYSSGASMDPVVSFEAAFNMTVYAGGTWLSDYGGTSFAAPTVAGEWALLEEQKDAASGSARMGDINPVLYAAHDANEAGVSGASTDPFVAMTDVGVAWDTGPFNSYNWYYTNLTIEQPYDAVLPGWFNTIDNPAGPGWNYLEGLGAPRIASLAQELTAEGLLTAPTYEVKIVTTGGLAPIANNTLTAGTSYTFEVVDSTTGAPVVGAALEEYSGMSNDGGYGGGTVQTATTNGDGQFTYAPTSGSPPGGDGATTYGYFLVSAGGLASFISLAIAQPTPSGTLSLCVEEADGECAVGSADVTTFTTSYTGYYQYFPEAYVTLNGVPAVSAVITEVSVDVSLYYDEDPTLPVSTYAPGATLGTFVTGEMGDANFWTDAATAELNGALPTEVVTLTASYDGVVSNTVTVFIEPQSGSFDTSDLSLNAAGTAVVGTVTFSAMKYLDFLNISVGKGPGQYLNTSYTGDVSAGQVAVDLSTTGLTGNLEVTLEASGSNDVSVVEIDASDHEVIEDEQDVQDPITWSDVVPLTTVAPDLTFQATALSITTTLATGSAVNATWENFASVTLTGFVWFDVTNGQGQTVWVSATSLTLAPSAVGSAYLGLSTLAAGTYTVEVFVTTSQGIPISVTEATSVTVA